MPTLQTIVFPTPEQEPVTLALLKAQVRQDSDVDDALLTLKLQAARDAAEQYCGRAFAPCVVRATYEVGEAYTPDPLAGAPTAVEGFYTDLADFVLRTSAAYQAEYLKGISVSRDYPAAGYGWGGTDAYGHQLPRPTYTVTYPVEATPDKVPPAVKEAILKLAAELYENRESSAIGREALLAVSYRALLAPYRLTNVLYT